jgi:hypothetical protein
VTALHVGAASLPPPLPISSQPILLTLVSVAHLSAVPMSTRPVLCGPTNVPPNCLKLILSCKQLEVCNRCDEHLQQLNSLGSSV